jgi:hypothetical protein
MTDEAARGPWDDLVRAYSEVIPPNPAALSLPADLAPIVEVGAGNGTGPVFSTGASSGNGLYSGPLAGHDDGMLDLTDYELAWPPELFAAEAKRILGRPGLGQQAIDLLLREAFRDDNAAEDVSALASRSVFGSDRDPRSVSDIVTELAGNARHIRRSSAPQPYWPQRHGQDVPGTYLDARRARRGFADLIQELESRGYLDQVFPRRCVDGDEPEADPAAELEKRLGIPGLWPLAPDEWDDDTFYGLVEVYHDLVSRPRVRIYHDFSGCGWHYSHFATTTGREVYRWKADELLAAAGISYRLADRGEDLGRLAEIFDDGRTQLVSASIENTQPDTAGRVRHAIALFRGRTATVEDRRSAAIALAGILEERRPLIRAELTTGDEGALFQIANKFAIRHRNEQQLEDYDPAFLDWIFWWYLGTVELTNRIIARQAGQDT